MKKLLLCLLVLAGCSRTYWLPEYRPVTQEEREAVAKYVEKLMGQTPMALAGHDQDWDNAIAVAHDSGCRIYCKARLFEYKGGPFDARYTGRWMEVDSLKTEDE